MHQLDFTQGPHPGVAADVRRRTSHGVAQIRLLTSAATSLLKVEFEAEVTAGSPTAVEMKAFQTAAIGDEWQRQPLMARYRQVPSSKFGEVNFRVAPAAHKRLIGHTDHVESKVMERVA